MISFLLKLETNLLFYFKLYCQRTEVAGAATGERDCEVISFDNEHRFQFSPSLLKSHLYVITRYLLCQLLLYYTYLSLHNGKVKIRDIQLSIINKHQNRKRLTIDRLLALHLARFFRNVRRLLLTTT